MVSKHIYVNETVCYDDLCKIIEYIKKGTYKKKKTNKCILDNMATEDLEKFIHFISTVMTDYFDYGLRENARDMIKLIKDELDERSVVDGI